MLRTQDKRLFVGRRLSDIGLLTFRDAAYELVGDEANSHGITIAASGTNHVKGSYVTLGTTVMDCDGFYLQIVPGTSGNDFLVDIATGGAGSEVVILPNVACGAGTVGNWSTCHPVYIPLPIPAGTVIRARCQSNSTSSAEVWASVILARGKQYYAQRKSRATAYGVTTASTHGTDIDPGGSANTNGSWTEVSSSVNRIDYVLVCSSSHGGGATASWFAELGIGGAGSEALLVPGLQYRRHTGLDQTSPFAVARFAEYPEGARLSARARCSITGAGVNNRVICLSVIGFD